MVGERVNETGKGRKPRLGFTIMQVLTVPLFQVKYDREIGNHVRGRLSLELEK